MKNIYPSAVSILETARSLFDTNDLGEIDLDGVNGEYLRGVVELTSRLVQQLDKQIVATAIGVVDAESEPWTSEHVSQPSDDESLVEQAERTGETVTFSDLQRD